MVDSKDGDRTNLLAITFKLTIQIFYCQFSDSSDISHTSLPSG